EHVQLLVLRIEMRGDADPDARPVIAEEAPPVELRGDLPRAGEVEHHRAAPLLRQARRAQREAVLVDKVEQPLRLPQRLLADAFDADLAKDLDAGAGVVERGD